MRPVLLVSLFLWLGFAGAVSAREGAGDRTMESGLLDRASVLKSAAGVSLTNYPDADSVLVDDWVRVVYQPDGTDVVWDDTYLKVLTEKGREEAQSLSLNYNVFYDTVTVVRVEVIKPDGSAKVVDVAAQSQTMVDRSQMAANIYDPNDRVLQVGIPDLEPGDVLHYITRHRNLKTRMPNTWADYQVFEGKDPIKRYLYEVIAPTSRPLERIELKDAVSGTVTATTNRNGAFITYRWEVRDVPQIFMEPNMPEYWSCVQRLLVSTIPDWQTVSKWYWGISEPHLNASSKEIAAQVHDLVRSETNEQQKIKNLFKYVSQKIRYMGITTETEAPGYEPHDVSITFGNKYGVCRDKAALLVAMLRQAGVKGFPVLINAGPKKDEGVPMPYFNHAIVAAQLSNGSYVLMDPTDESTADLLPSYLCDKSFLVARPEGEALQVSPIVPATQNLLRVSSQAKFNERGALVMQSDLHFSGINDNMYRGHFASLGADERQRFFDSRIGQLLPGARVTQVVIIPRDLADTSFPLQARLWIELPDYVVESDSHQMLALPWIGTGFGTVNHILGSTGLDQRRFPLQTEIACGVEETITVELAPGLAPLAVARVPDITADDLEFRHRVTVVSNLVTGTAAFVLKGVEFPPARYAALKQSLQDMEYARRQRVVLAKPVLAIPYPDAEIVNRDTRIVVQSEHEWTTTEDVTIKVLSYAGKKKHSELKFDFNPAWETLTLTNATVTIPARFGKTATTKTLAPQEVNVMDAEWVASAPRYPAAKTLVASLPGVEVGSTIRYTVTRTRRDRPFFSAVATLRGFDPVVQSALTVTAPAGLRLSQWHDGDGLVQTLENAGPKVSNVWKITNQPALHREETMPPLWSFCPSVALSSGNWTNYAQAVIGPMLAAAKGNPEARKLARALVKSSAGDTAKATVLRDAVVRSVRLAGPQADDLPVSILTAADVTLREGYGNTRDRALLLYVMLDEAGLKPEFVLASSACPTVPELRELWMAAPQGSTFDTVLVRSRAGGQPVYFNDTDQYAALGATPFDGHVGLLASGEQISIASLTDRQDGMRVTQKVTLDTNGTALINVAITHHGMDAAALEKLLQQQTPEERRRYAQEVIAAISQAAKLVGEFKVEGAKMEYAVAVPHFAVREGNLLHFAIPAHQTVILPGNAADRRNPVFLQHRTQTRMQTEVLLPKGELLIQPPRFDAYAPGGGIRVLQRVDQRPADRRIVVTQETEFTPTLIPVHRYDELKDWNARVRHPSGRAFLLQLAD